MTESIDVKVSLLVSKVQDLYSSYGWAPDKEFDEILTDAYRLDYNTDDLDRKAFFEEINSGWREMYLGDY